ncbi:MAG: hypothetical protein AAGG81_08905 [Chlamydiota bacterium]
MNKKLSKTILEFIRALLVGKPVVLRDGSWFIESTFSHYLRKLFGGEESFYVRLASEMEGEIDKISQHPILFSEDPSKLTGIEQYDEYLLAADIIDKKLIKFTSEKSKKARNKLLFKTISCKYRIEESNGGIDASPVQQPLVNVLKKMLYGWKKNNDLVFEKKLTERDLHQMQVASQFPEFVLLLLKDSEIQEAFMQWVFRDGNRARIFIEYPQLQEKLVECNLNGRIGRISEEDLKILKVPVSNENLASVVTKKIVTLPFEGVERNILDESQEVTFKGNYTLKIGEIFEVFKNKNYEVGELEYFAHGFTNWNCHHWGYWDDDNKEHQLIDLNHHQWWHQLPILEIISQEEALKRYEIRLDGTTWCVAASATRGTASLDFENTHAFLEIAIPWGDGRYAVYDFGKFARKYPSSFFEGISMFCHNLHATVSYPDENIFYSHRQQMYHAYELPPDKGIELMENIKQDMITSQERNFVYQIESENCAKWVHQNLEQVIDKEDIPNLFKMHLLDTEPIGAVSVIFSLIKKLPKCIQTPIMTLCHLPLGAAKQTWIIEKGKHVCKSLTRHEFWLTGEVYLPALLHKQKEEGILSHFREFIDMLCHLLTGVVLRFDFVRKLWESTQHVNIKNVEYFLPDLYGPMQAHLRLMRGYPHSAAESESNSYRIKPHINRIFTS